MTPRYQKVGRADFCKANPIVGSEAMHSGPEIHHVVVCDFPSLSQQVINKRSSGIQRGTPTNCFGRTDSSQVVVNNV
jgi:hypothetical protein